MVVTGRNKMHERSGSSQLNTAWVVSPRDAVIRSLLKSEKNDNICVHNCSHHEGKFCVIYWKEKWMTLMEQSVIASTTNSGFLSCLSIIFRCSRGVVLFRIVTCCVACCVVLTSHCVLVHCVLVCSVALYCVALRCSGNIPTLTISQRDCTVSGLISRLNP